MTQPYEGDRTVLWLPLVRRLTERFPDWAIWKNADAAFAGSGDIDSAAPARKWNDIVHEFRTWARTFGLGPVIECRHPPRTMFLIALLPSRRSFLELDVLGRKYFRGGTLFRADELAPIARLDERGFRTIRPAAQALILLLCNGLRWGGAQDRAGLEKRHVIDLFRMDAGGVTQAALCFHLPVDAVRAAVESLLEGRWNRRAMLAIESAAAIRALREPEVLLSRFRFRAFSKRRCPILQSVFYGDRTIPGDPAAWLSEVAREHPVYD